MATFHIRNEVVFRAPNRVGLLADVAEYLAGRDINVLALRGYEEGDTGVVLVYTDDSRLAVDALATLDGEVSSFPVIIAEVANEPGQLAAIARILTNANIDIVQAHATTGKGSDRAMVVLQTSNDVAALEALQKL
jgi:hypothetical protein